MVNRQLINYIKSEEAQGYSSKQLYNYLVQQGYNLNEIQEAIDFVNRQSQTTTPSKGVSGSRTSNKNLIFVTGIVLFFVVSLVLASVWYFMRPISEEIIDCGQTTDISTLPEIQIDLGEGMTGTTQDYESDPALVCFGEHLLKCSKAKVIVNGEGDLINMEIKSKDDSSCLVRQEFGEMTSEQYKQFANSYVECPLPIDMIPEMRCPMGICREEVLPGQIASGVVVSLVMTAIFNPSEISEIGCTGTLVDKLRK